MANLNETRIVVCKKCGIRTRHEWRRWEQQSLLIKITGHVRLMEGWVCTKCGRQTQVRSIGMARVSAHT